MENSDITSSVDSLVRFLSSTFAKKPNLALTQSAKLAELSESRTELLGRIQGLKQDLQNWRSKLDNQVQSHRNELVELRKSLNVEVDQLRSEFQDLRSTLQQQQEDVTASLRNLGLQDTSNDAGIFASNPMDAGTTIGNVVNDEGSNGGINESGSSKDKIIAEEFTENENGTDVHLSSSEIGGVDIEH